MTGVTIDRELLELSLNGDEQQQAKARNKLRTLLSTYQDEVQRLREALASAEKNERHRNNSETRYWCDQYKQLARAALATALEVEK